MLYSSYNLVRNNNSSNSGGSKSKGGSGGGDGRGGRGESGGVSYFLGKAFFSRTGMFIKV